MKNSMTSMSFNNRFRLACFVLTVLLNSSASFAQCSCNNIGFEDNSLGCWKLKYGKFLGGDEFYWSTVTSAENDQHQITDKGNYDPIADCISTNFLPQTAPGSQHSLRLGDAKKGKFAASASVSFTVDQSTTLFQLQYAVVFSDPGHPEDDQPRFEVIVGTDCGDYFVVSNVSIPGFESCTNDWRIRPWTTVGIDLSSYIGQQVTIEFVSADCAWSGHGGYAYIDVSCVALDIDIGNYCPGDASITLEAPSGFSSYEWTNLNTGEKRQGQQISIQDPQGGETYQVEIISVTGCSAFLEYTLPLIPASSEITIDYIGEEAFCVGGRGTIEINGDNIGEIYLNGILQNSQQIQLLPTVSTSYTVEVFGTGECSKDATYSFDLEVFPTPELELSASELIVCPGETVTLSYQEVNGVYYEWIGLSEDNNSSLELIIDSTSTYTVVASSPNGCTISEEISVYTIEEDEIAYEIDEINVCPPGSPTILYVSIDNISSVTCAYLLYVSPGNADTILRNYEILNRDFTLYPEEDMVIPISFWSRDSCSMIQDTIYINVLDDAPSIQLTNNQFPVCRGDTLTIDVSGDFDSLICTPTPLDITNNSITVAPAQDVVYRLQGLRQHCEKAEATIFVFAEDNVNYTIESDSLSICENSTVDLMISTNPANTIRWLHNNSQQTSVTVAPQMSGYYPFEISSPDGCVARDSILVNVLSQETISYELDSLTICKGTHANIGVRSPEEIEIYWPHLNSFSENIVVSPTTSTFFEVRITSPSTCTTVSDSIYVKVDSSSVQLTPISDTLICPQDSILISVSGINFTNVYWEELDTLATAFYLPIDTFSTYTIRGISANPEDCPSTPISFEFASSPPADVLIKSNKTANCPDEELVLTVIVNSNIQSFFWIDTGTSDTSRTVRTTVGVPNNYSISVLDENGCENEFSIDLGYFDTPQAPTYEVENITVCSGEPVVIDLMASNYAKIIWHQLPNYFEDTLLYEGLTDSILTFDIYDSTNCIFLTDSIYIFMDNQEIIFPDILSGCQGDVIPLSFPENIDSVYWEELDKIVYGTDSIALDTNHILHATFYKSNGCITNREINLRAFSSDDLVVPSTTYSICLGDSILLEVFSDLDVSWYGMDNKFLGDGPTILLSPDTTAYYIVSAHNKYCSFDDTVFITTLDPDISLSIDTKVYDLCEGQTLEVELLCDSTLQVNWDNGQEGCKIQIIPDTTSFLSFQYEDPYGCKLLRDSILVRVTEQPFAIFSETTHCVRPGDVIQPIDTCNCSFIWQDKTRGTTYRIEEGFTEEMIFLISSNRCGISRDTILISSEEHCNFFAPNTFSPNGDGINDRWKIFFGCTESLIKDFHLAVYNRWGGEVFSTNDIHQDWNGTDTQIGVYVWYMSFYNPICQRKYIEGGTITIIK